MNGQSRKTFPDLPFRKETQRDNWNSLHSPHHRDITLRDGSKQNQKGQKKKGGGRRGQKGEEEANGRGEKKPKDGIPGKHNSTNPSDQGITSQV